MEVFSELSPGCQSIQDNFSVTLELDSNFKMYKTRFNFLFHANVDCVGHKD